ncbi:MAG: hypothetical protein EOP47_28040, partial [Sphingobacteriaceae bacterium]
MSKFLPLKLFALLLLIAVSQASAQSFVFRQYTTDNGLSHNNVNCSLQDSKGFMWFGTLNGLNRFDGRIFKIFRKDSTKDNSIGSNFISALCEDKEKNLWVGTHNGLWRFDAETERFYLADFTYTQWITNIICDDSGDLWFVSSQKLYKYNFKTNTHKVYTIVSPTTVITNPNKDIYVGTAQGHLYKLDAKNDSFDHITLVDTNSLPGARVITDMLYTVHNSILIATRAGNLKLFDTETNKLKNIEKNFNNDGAVIKTLIKYDASNYWIGTTNGINIYNIASGKLSNLPNNQINITDNDVNTFCRGSDGGI